MKKLILVLGLCPFFLLGQNTFNVQSNYGNPFCILRSILPTDSCYYVTGIITDSTNSIGNIFIKFDLDGNAVFSKELISSTHYYQTWFSELIPIDDGSMVEVGLILDSLVRGAVFKYNDQGDTILTKTYLSPYPDNEIFVPFDIVELPNGGYAVLNAVEMADLNNEILITYMNDTFGIQSSKLFGSNSDEILGSMLLANEGGLIIGSNRANTNITNVNYKSRTYIFGVDSVGNVQWEYLSPNNQLQDVAHSMVRTDDGGLVVASGKGIEEVFGGIGFLNWHGYIFKLNASHQLVWGRQFRGKNPSPSNALRKLLRANDGSGFVAYGMIDEDVSDGIERTGSWMVKVSNHGDSLWARYYTFFDGHYRQPDPIDFKATPDGGYIVCGQTNEGNSDWGWLMKLDSFGCLIPGCNANDGPNATGEERAVLKLAIYPNPASDFLNFELRTARLLTGASFRIIDIDGRVIKELKGGSQHETFIVPVRDWADGVYWLQYMEEGGVMASEKFIVAKK